MRVTTANADSRRSATARKQGRHGPMPVVRGQYVGRQSPTVGVQIDRRMLTLARLVLLCGVFVAGTCHFGCAHSEAVRTRRCSVQAPIRRQLHERVAVPGWGPESAVDRGVLGFRAVCIGAVPARLTNQWLSRCTTFRTPLVLVKLETVGRLAAIAIRAPRRISRAV